MGYSVPDALVNVVMITDSLEKGDFPIALQRMRRIQEVAEKDAYLSDIAPLLELSAYTLLVYTPVVETLTDSTLALQAEDHFGDFLRDSLGVPCDAGILETVLMSPPWPKENIPAGMEPLTALFAALALIASINDNIPHDDLPNPVVFALRS